MADPGNSSTTDTSHKHKGSSWLAVALICVASIVLGFAFVLGHAALAVVGGVIMLAGLVRGITGKIMDDAH